MATVADMAITLRSGRSTSRAASVKARPRSVCRCRSWKSSKTTIPTPGKESSDCSRRVSIPSVTTSIRVALPVRRSSLVTYPTVLPTSSPRRADMRVAAARAATRRGSRTTILLSPSQSSSSRRSGTTVVLPAPASATSTAVPSPSADRSSGMTSSTGKPVGAGPSPTTVTRRTLRARGERVSGSGLAIAMRSRLMRGIGRIDAWTRFAASPTGSRPDRTFEPSSTTTGSPVTGGRRPCPEV